VGYKSPEDAAKAVKYFNKSFIRMSRIGVEIARPVRSIPQSMKAIITDRDYLYSHLMRHYQFRERRKGNKQKKYRKRKRWPKLQALLATLC